MASYVRIAVLAVFSVVIAAEGQTPAGVTLKAKLVDPDQPSDVRIEILRWSTDEERTAIVGSMTAPAPGAARGARGERPDVTDPFGAFGGFQNNDAPPDGVPAARGGFPPRGGGAFGGRGGRGAAPPPFDPIASLAGAIADAKTIGYLWTGENSGYAIKYGYRAAMPDGGERIILATTRRVASLDQAFADGVGQQFTVIEIRLNASGAGQAKASLHTKVVVDAQAQTLALDNFTGAPALFENVKK